MSDTVPIGTIPGLTSQLDGIDILIATLGVSVTVTSVLLRHTDFDDGGATDTSVVAAIRNATGGGGDGIAVTIPDQTQSKTQSGSLSVSATQSIYLRVTTGSNSMNLTGSIVVDSAAGVTTSLTNLARVKEFRDIDGAAEDAILNTLIAGVSKRMQSYMRRNIYRIVITGEKHDGSGRSDILQLDEFPIIVPPSVVLTDANGDTVDATTYEVDTALARLIRVESGAASPWAAGRRNFSVDYTGGFDTVPEDLALAATIQVSYLYQWTSRSGAGGRLGNRGEILDAGGSAQFLTGAWAPGVLQAMDPYRNLMAA